MNVHDASMEAQVEVKIGTITSKWKTCTMVLEEGVLSVFKDEVARTKGKTVAKQTLTGSSKAKVIKLGSRLCPMQIETGTKKLVVDCACETDRTAWIAVIARAADHADFAAIDDVNVLGAAAHYDEDDDSSSSEEMPWR